MRRTIGESFMADGGVGYTRSLDVHHDVFAGILGYKMAAGYQVNITSAIDV
jgi:hypothetical protein